MVDFFSKLYRLFQIFVHRISEVTEIEFDIYFQNGRSSDLLSKFNLTYNPKPKYI